LNMIKFKSFFCAALMASVLAGVTAHAQQLGTKRTLNLAVAKIIAAAAEKEATANHWAMYITIVDETGTPMLLERTDNAQIASYDISVGKAQTALRFKRATKTMEETANGGRVSTLRLPGALPLEGGVPFVVDGQVIGAIGISGGASNQDSQVAQAGVAALEALLKK
jgi:glc operon protein GlcG